MDGAIAPRLGLANFRDVGGHPAGSGQQVRRGLLYRSVALADAADADLAALAELGVSTVFDLRTAHEQERAPDRLPPSARHVALDVMADAGEADPAAMFRLMQDPASASRELADGRVERFWLASYRDFVRLPSARAAFGRLYRELADADPAALVHCTTGKDRTGWAVAALLLYLGVRADVVMREYLLSDTEVRAAYAHMVDDFVAAGGSREIIEPMMGVQPSFLDAAIEVMLGDYGSVEAYLSVGLGLEPATLARLRTRFLEPA